MRLCRFLDGDRPRPAFYADDHIVPLLEAARARDGGAAAPEDVDDLLAYLPPDGPRFPFTRELAAWVEGADAEVERIAIASSRARLLAPIPAPPKLFLLAGNYAEHIRESGGMAVEREKTFPYVFMKPPSTTINHPGGTVPVPRVSPAAIDWEIELAVVIGRTARHVPEASALEHVAAYTVINDISDRRFRPNPDRAERPRDAFFDWLHGKWHDGFCPMGPCVRSADSVDDPQSFPLRLEVNGKVHQDSSTAYQVFPVAAVVEFISNIVTLEPGDVISTGTPSGVGSAKGVFLSAGDRLRATIDGIGALESVMGPATT